MMRPFALLCVLGLVLLSSTYSSAQTIIDDGEDTATAGGVYIDAQGTVRARKVDRDGKLEAQRVLAKQGNAQSSSQLTYVSLPRLLAQVKALADKGQPIPEEMRYLSGLTQIKYVFVYPQEQDLVLAGTSEALDTSNPVQPVGKISGRPALHLEDLLMALALSQNPQGIVPFGCSIDPQPN